MFHVKQSGMAKLERRHHYVTGRGRRDRAQIIEWHRGGRAACVKCERSKNGNAMPNPIRLRT